MAQKHHALTRLVVAAAGTVLLAGCPAPSPRPSVSGESLSTPSGDALESQSPIAIAPPPRPVPPPRENRLSPATGSLVNQAHVQMARGDADAASSTLDRALRIEPNNPLLWIERGKLRLADNDAHQAEVCGRKALQLASGDRTAQKQAGLLLADALRAQQRNQDAHEVESQPFMR